MQPLEANLYTTTFTYKDLLFRKLYNAIICSIFSQILILHISLIIIKCDLYNPLTWFNVLYSNILSPRTWLYMLPHIFIIFSQCLICAKDYVFSSTFSSSRFQKFLSVFSLHNLLLICLHSLVGVVQIWLVLSLAGEDYKRLITKNNEQISILVEETLFLLLGGLWIGMYYFAKVYMSDKYLNFPVIQQQKLTLFKHNFTEILSDSFKLSIWPCVCFIMFYYFCGNNVKHNFSFLFNLDYNNTYKFQIYLYHWLFAVLFFFNMNLIKLFFSLFLTEPVEFPLIKFNKDVLTLQESVNLEKLPIVQSLACLDLYLLSLWSPSRRQLLFTLSQPGAHPHNWNTLIEEFLKLYKSYIDILNKSMESINDKSIHQIKPSIIPCSPNEFQKFRNLRDMTSPFTSASTIINSPRNNLTKVEEKEKPHILIRFQDRIINFMATIKVILGINYFFGEIPQRNIQKCLSNGNLIIWSSEAISKLICDSLKEDRYGVVQKDIPQVITTLVRLSQILEKLNKIPALSRRVAGTENFNYKMKNAISSALRRSLYNICLTFKDYLDEIDLNKEVTNYLYSTVFIKI